MNTTHGSPAEPSLGELVTRLSEQTSRLVRDELRLAQAEMKESAKQAGLGAGLFSAAGVLGLFGFGTAIATAIIALALALPWWLSALIMTVVLFVAAAVAGVLGRRHVQQVSPKPERAIENVKRDVQEVKESAQHDHTH